jgi:hypothetical protein
MLLLLLLLLETYCKSPVHSAVPSAAACSQLQRTATLFGRCYRCLYIVTSLFCVPVCYVSNAVAHPDHARPQAARQTRIAKTLRFAGKFIQGAALVNPLRTTANWPADPVLGAARPPQIIAPSSYDDYMFP